MAATWWREIQRMHMTGSMAPLFWTMLTVCMVLPFLTLWFGRVRRSPGAILVISLLINLGMWIERFLIVVSSTMKNSLSFDWGTYRPQWPEIAITAATFAGFVLLYLLFSKAFPLISLWEVKEGWRIDRWRREGVIEVESDVPSIETPVVVPAPAGVAVPAEARS
jgi:Ni/Fe-hydrogenase subunit HybB-like protein